MHDRDKSPARILLDKIAHESPDPVAHFEKLHRVVESISGEPRQKTGKGPPVSISRDTLNIATTAIARQEHILHTTGLDLTAADALRGYANLASDIHTVQHAKVSADASGNTNASESHGRLIRFTAPFHVAAQSASDILSASASEFSPAVRLETSLGLLEMLGDTSPPRLARALGMTAVEAIASPQLAALPDQTAQFAARLVKQRKYDIREHEFRIIDIGLDAVDRATTLTAHQRRSHIETFAGRTVPESEQATRVVDAWKTALREENDGLSKPQQKRLREHLPSAAGRRGPPLLYPAAAEMYFSFAVSSAVDTVKSVLKRRPGEKPQTVSYLE